ncbi:unnamed protein product [Linum trigynum]|uniref:Uncharacterized protein n=1 Tax=Linum trigynum TaxID=586398 RepID=A0AAV2GUU7_9ROSI
MGGPQPTREKEEQGKKKIEWRKESGRGKSNGFSDLIWARRNPLMVVAAAAATAAATDSAGTQRESGRESAKRANQGIGFGGRWEVSSMRYS